MTSVSSAPTWSDGRTLVMLVSPTPSVDNLGSDRSVLFLVLTMLAIVVLAALVVLYVAYPHRGEEMPVVPWVGETLRKGVHAMPTLGEQHGDRVANQRH